MNADYERVALLLLGAIILASFTWFIYPTPKMQESKVDINKEATLISTGPMYGCPGCPSDFKEFADDICSRNIGINVVITDGKNTSWCPNVVGSGGGDP